MKNPRELFRPLTGPPALTGPGLSGNGLTVENGLVTGGPGDILDYSAYYNMSFVENNLNFQTLALAVAPALISVFTI
jgi:hypothetical protein